MTAKNGMKFKKPEEYEAEGRAVEAAPVIEVFFRLKLVPASLVQYAVEQVTLENNTVVERKLITERDILPITLSKIEDALVRQIRK